MEMDKLFFSVKKALRIDGTIYRPSICYEMPKSLRKVIFSLREEGTVTTYDKPVIFVSGVARPLKEINILDTKKQANKFSFAIKPTIVTTYPREKSINGIKDNNDKKDKKEKKEKEAKE